MNALSAENEKTTPKILPYGTYKTVTCYACAKEVRVELVPFGGKNIGVCPECKRLAYNGD